jgi:TRAP-type transport system periplasmic protein
MKSAKGKRILLVGVVSLCMFVSMGIEAFAASNPFTLKFATACVKAMTCGPIYDKFAENVQTRSNGQLNVEVFYGGTLGNEGTALQTVLAGNAQMFSISIDNISAFTKAYFFANLPYIFESPQHAMEVARGPVGQAAKKRIENELKMKVLGNPISGFFRTLVNSKKEIRVPADCKGLKFRTTTSEIDVALMKAFGIIPTPIPWAETYTSIRQGVADGTHLQHYFVFASKIYEVVKFSTEINAVATFHVVGMRKDVFDKLDPKLQQILLEEGKKMEDLFLVADEKDTQLAKAALMKAGIKIYTPTKAELNQFKELAKPIWKEYEKEVPADVIRQIQK